MTEIEIVRKIGRLLPEDVRLVVRPGGRVELYDGHLLITSWAGARDFLFGDPNGYRASFFRWIDFWGNPGRTDRSELAAWIYDSCPWVRSLAGCSSVEELELKMAVMGVDVSGKTPEKERDE